MLTVKTAFFLVVSSALFGASILCVKEHQTFNKPVKLQPHISSRSNGSGSLLPDNAPSVVTVVVLQQPLHDPMLSNLSQQYGVKHQEILSIWNVVVEETRAYSIDPFLMMALIQEESSYDKTAHSHMGALGLTQVIPKYHRTRLKHGEKLTDIRVSVRIGVEVLDEYIRLENGDIPRALQRYNGNLQDKKQRYARHILFEKSKLEMQHIQSLVAQQLRSPLELQNKA